MPELIIAPSVLSMDYTRMCDQISALEDSAAKWIHFDVMDGHFVPNLSFGPDILSQFRRLTDLFLDVHLMVTDPVYFADVFAKAGADQIVFHTEALNNDPIRIEALLDSIHARGLKAGFSVNPDTPVDPFLDLLPKCDVVLIMSVHPGYGGQSFIPDVLPKARILQEARKTKNPKCRIEIDGGMNEQTAARAREAGVDTVVAGSYIFRQEDVRKAVDSLC